MIEKIIEQYYEEEFLKADGFDDAIIGFEENEMSMKDKKEILDEIKKLKDNIYKLTQEEACELVDNTEEIETYRYAIITLEWVLNL